MEEYTPRKKPMYPGEVTHKNIMAIFDGCGDFVYRPLKCGTWELKTYTIDGLTSGGDISDYVFKPIAELLSGDSMGQLYEHALQGTIYSSVADPCKDLDAVALKLVNGFCVILFPGVGALAFEAKTSDKRGPSAPEVENTVKGPKDAFVETVRSNTSLVRRHLRSPQLRFAETMVGRRSLTNVSVVWLKGITNMELVEKLRQRLDEIDIDGFLSPSAVEEYVTGSRLTTFPLLQYTERTDRFCQGLLDGRVGLLVDGLPLGYLVPTDLGYLMDSMEDRSRDFISASFVKTLRWLALVTSLLLPAVYVALLLFHAHWIPEMLRNTIMNTKKDVPFTVGGEVIGLLIAYELLQESGVHLPQAIGQSVSTIGGIVVGTAAVEAGLISPVVLIAVSIAGVCGFVLPNRDLANAIRVWRLVLVILGTLGGLGAVALGVAALLAHLATLRCLGIPYLRMHRASGRGLLRCRLRYQKYRDPALKPEDKRNQK